MNLDLKEVIECPDIYLNKKIVLQGWIRNHRKQKNFGFINFYDGTILNEIQIVYDTKLPNFDEVQALNIGSAITVEGELVYSPGGNQSYEINASSVKLEGASTEDFPIQPKKHTLEYLRDVAYMRPRTRIFQAAFRVRSIAAYAIHKYFNDNGYVYVHTPIITSNDGEGAGETFQVTTLDLEKIKGGVDYSKDFFGKKTALCVTGQLEGEAFALAYKKIYTFGPTFRAENSNTKTHAAEFWMIEPEIAFADINRLMEIEEDFLKYVVKYVMNKARTEIEFFERQTPGLIKKLDVLINSKVAKATHKEAIEILLNSGKEFEIKPVQGKDLAREHEKYLTEEYFNSPVFVYDWPKGIKAFYMKQNPDGETVAGVDLLVPGSGELMGGSQREEDLDKLVRRMAEMNIPEKGFDWYLNLRKFGGCVHSGFGMGFERLIMYLTGIDNIRDVLPFARTPFNCEF
jgi:asparaginyl-tRNA synthetase